MCLVPCGFNGVLPWGAVQLKQKFATQKRNWKMNGISPAIRKTSNKYISLGSFSLGHSQLAFLNSENGDLSRAAEQLPKIQGREDGRNRKYILVQSFRFPFRKRSERRSKADFPPAKSFPVRGIFNLILISPGGTQFSSKAFDKMP